MVARAGDRRTDMERQTLRTISSLGLIVALAACGGGGSGYSPSPPAPPPPPAPAFGVGGTVSGLNGAGLTLVNNAGAPLAVNANGAFSFPGIAQGSAYAVTVGTQPFQPWQTCTVTNGAGTVSATVTNIAVACTTNSYRVGGPVTGLAGLRLAVQLNGATAQPIAQNGTFTFAASVPSGE